MRGKVKGGRLFLVGVDGIKSTLCDRLARGAGIRFSHTLEKVYFEQLASERKVIRYMRGQPVRRFERIPGRRAEALDCLVYAHAARSGLQLNLDVRADELHGGPPPAVPTSVQSPFVQAW
jgi:phage terminase large subunit GpA-like protein